MFVYDPVQKDIDEGPPESSLPPETPDVQTTTGERMIAKRQEMRIAKR